jgi:hypothetical protein
MALFPALEDRDKATCRQRGTGTHELRRGTLILQYRPLDRCLVRVRECAGMSLERLATTLPSEAAVRRRDGAAGNASRLPWNSSEASDISHM